MQPVESMTQFVLVFNAAFVFQSVCLSRDKPARRCLVDGRGLSAQDVFSLQLRGSCGLGQSRKGSGSELQQTQH